MIGQVEVEIETRDITAFLTLELIDVEPGEDHASFGMIGMRKRQKPNRKRVLVLDLVRRQPRESIPRPPFPEFHPNALLQRLTA
jgi:hypothetical protein